MSDVAAARLAECEKVIERGLATFVQVGEALLEIRDGVLYRETHSTFEDYCRERWGMDRTYAHRHIEAAKITELLPIGNNPATESVARELAPLKNDERELVQACRESHSTFEDYCRDRWGMDRRYANRHIEAAAIVGSIDPTEPAPTNVAVTRELAPLKNDERELVQAWREATA